MSKVISLVQSLKAHAPLFYAKKNNLKHLKSPNEFYNHLKNGIQTANKRICLTSLYFGTDEYTKSLISLLQDRHRSIPTLQTHIHFDYLRGTRDSPNSSLDLFRQLKNNHPDNISISLYRTPLLEGWRRVIPARWNEIFGLSHMKFAVFDDEVLITGGNFSKTYFTDRVDRYLAIKEAKDLSDYFYQLIQQVVSQFSFQISSQGDLIESHKISQSTNIVEEFIQKWKNNRNTSKEEEGNVFIFPTLQFGAHNIRQDEEFLDSLLIQHQGVFPDSDFSLSTGYFNLSPRALAIIKNVNRPWKILLSSPESNGFFSATGVSSHIPLAYRSLEYQFLTHTNHSTKPSLVLNEHGEECIYEYRRDKWTFHAKGLWIDNNDFMIGMFGSSNFGHRSFDRDLEAQLTVITDDIDLVNLMRAERDELFRWTSMVSAKDLEKSHLMNCVTSILKSYL